METDRVSESDQEEISFPDTPPPGDPPRRSFPSIFQAFLLALLLVATLGLCRAFIKLILDRSGIDAGELTLGTITNLVGFAILLPFGAMLTRLPFREVFPFRPVPIALFPAMAMVLVGWQIFGLKINMVIQDLLPPPEWLTEFFQELFSRQTNPFLQVILLCVIAPLTEELFFRGVILRGLMKRYRLAPAIIVSSLLFALTHANPWQFFPPLVVGLYFGWWCVKTRSLWPGLVGHAFYNLLPWLALFLMRFEVPLDSSLPESPAQPPIWFFAMGLAMMIAGTLSLIRLFRRMPEPDPAR